MDKKELMDQLSGLISEDFKNKGIDLIELKIRYEGLFFNIRILADKFEGGITIGECSRLNKELCAILDEKNLLPQGYTVEVASPGLDRPLSTKKDFLRVLGLETRFFLNTKVSDKLEWAGLVKGCDDESVQVEVDGNILQIPLAAINKAWRKI